MSPDDQLAAIAREAAAGLIEVVESAIGWHIIYVGPSVHTVPLRDVEGVNARVKRCVEHLADGIRAALDRARREFPCPTGITAERLAEIEKDFAANCYGPLSHAATGSLLAEVYFLRRLCLDAEGLDAYLAGLAAGERKGWAKGAEAQHEADKDAVWAATSYADNTEPFYVKQACWDAVAVAPLATPPEPTQEGP